MRIAKKKKQKKQSQPAGVPLNLRRPTKAASSDVAYISTCVIVQPTVEHTARVELTTASASATTSSGRDIEAGTRPICAWFCHPASAPELDRFNQNIHHNFVPMVYAYIF